MLALNGSPFRYEHDLPTHAHRADLPARVIHIDAQRAGADVLTFASSAIYYAGVAQLKQSRTGWLWPTGLCLIGGENGDSDLSGGCLYRQTVRG